MCLPKNEGRTDRIIRATLAVVAAVVLLVFNKTLAVWAMWTIGILGAILLITAIDGFCLVYHLLKINTSGKKKAVKKVKKSRKR